MAEKINNTESRALFQFAKVMDNFSSSLVNSVNGIIKSSNLLCQDWRGAQAEQFMDYISQFKADINKNIDLFKQLQQNVYKRAEIYQEIENKKVGNC